MSTASYDAVLIVSFGGPEKRDDVLPFLRNVTRGRDIPDARLEEVAQHYYAFDGKSPHNEQIAELKKLLEAELADKGVDLPVYWGNRNWQPMLADTLRQMEDDGVKRAIAFVVSGYSSYSGCRQYRENIAAAQEAVGSDAPTIDKIRVFYNHPGFIGAMRERVGDALAELSDDERAGARIVFTAHSIPNAMAEGCDYEAQLREACTLVAEAYPANAWELVWQSRSGPPHVPWLEPDVCDYLETIHSEGATAVVVAPIGFLSDHLEVLYDLDHEAKDKADELGMTMARAGTVGTHPAFIAMIRELIEERLGPGKPKLALGERGPSHDVCPAGCCKPGRPGPLKPAAAGSD